MPAVTSASNWLVGIHKQSNEATPGTVADYEFPVFSGTPTPVQSIERVAVTDAAAIAGDPYKQAGEHWEATIEIPAYGNVLGRVLQGMWPTDTKTGAGPYEHAFSGLGATPPWLSMYSTSPGSFKETFAAGIISSVGFSFSEVGGPLRVQFSILGETPTVASYTVTTSAALADGYFTAVGATLKYDVDSGTPATVTNIQSATLTVDRPVTAVATANGTTLSNVGLGLVDPTFTLTLLYTDWEAYSATYYGAVAGTSASTTIVKGSLELNFVHTVTGTHAFKLAVPSAVFAAEHPQPNPDGSPLLVTVNGYATKPGSGEHVTPTLTNAVSTSY